MEKLAKFKSSSKVRILYASEHEVATAYHYLETYPDIPASLADWLSLVMAVRHEISVIQTFDRDFSDITHRESAFKDVRIWKR